MPDKPITEVIADLRELQGQAQQAEDIQPFDLIFAIARQAEFAEFAANAAPRLADAIDNLAMFVRRMMRVMALNNLDDREVYKQADKYLKAIGATGSILRNEDIQEQTAGAAQLAELKRGITE